MSAEIYKRDDHASAHAPASAAAASGGATCSPATATADGLFGECHSPPSVTRGAKCHYTVAGVDWVQGTGSRGLEAEVGVVLDAFFVRESRNGEGFLGYRHAEFWSGGEVTLCSDPSDERRRGWLLQVKGKACGRLSFGQQMELIERLGWLVGSWTRIDLAVDFMEGGGVIDCALASCERAELTGARKFDPKAPKKIVRGEVEFTGRGVVIGVRGKDGSGRYVRVYDKGLQTGEADAGEWERWEVEFTGDCAAVVAAALRADPRPVTAAGLAFGAIDFRERKGVERHLTRRERVSWFAAIVAGLELVRARAQREGSDLAGYAEHVRRTVAPTIVAFAKAVGQSVAEVWACLVGDQPVKLREGPVVREYVEMFGGPSPAG